MFANVKRRHITKFVAALVAVVCGLCSTAACQYAAVFSSYHAGKRYDFRLTHEQISKTPRWSDDAPNPPLSLKDAKSIGGASLKKIVGDAGKWRFDSISVVPVADRWVFLIAFEELLPPGCVDCFGSPFKVVVTMDGLPVVPDISTWEGTVR
jgi:hypothetical protein